MSRSSTGSRRRREDCGWRYLGASGVLQPLSQDFLYRSPQARIDETTRRHRDGRNGRR